MNKDVLIKYLNNNCTDKEFEELADWLKNEASTDGGKYWSFEHWETFEPDLKKKDEKKYSALLDKIHNEINLKNKGKADSKVITLSNIAKWLNRAAAILFIPLLGFVFYLLSNNNIQTDKLADLVVDSLEVIAPIGSRTVVQLSDGTEINLNYGSKIKYPRNFTGNLRGITLLGEGYFNVAHNPDKPFVVKTGGLNIKALGTEFNVQSYPGDDIISTTLVEGKVVIDKVLPNEKIDRVGYMLPGQHVIYNLNSGKTTSNRGNIDKYIAWKDGRMIFDNTPITEITRELSRKFNVDIEVTEEIKDLTYTVKFADDPLFLILDLMTETTPVTYNRFPRKKLSEGFFSKQKILIEKRK